MPTEREPVEIVQLCLPQDLVLRARKAAIADGMALSDFVARELVAMFNATQREKECP
jgi:hypothetical protein